MIELMPPLPMPPPTSGTPGRDSGQADFSQWLQPAVPAPFETPETAGAVLPGLGLSAGRETSSAPTLPVTPLPVHTALPSPAITTPPVLAPVSPMELQLVLPEAATLPRGEPGAEVRLVWTLSSPEVGGVVQLVATPWQLTAGDRLSQQLRLPAAIAASSAIMPSDAAFAARRVPVAPTPAVPVAGVVPARTPGVYGTSLPVFASTAQRAGATAAGSDAASAGNALLGATSEWPLRLLRWLNDGSHGATAWLRDFTLAPESIPALVQDLQWFAAAGNIRLERIVLNGQTLWASEPSTPPTA